jgi:hypothetical protein
MGADKISFSKELGLYPNHNSESRTNKRKNTQSSLDTLATNLERLGSKAEASTKELEQQRRRLRPTGSTGTSGRVTQSLTEPHRVTREEVIGSTNPLWVTRHKIWITRDSPKNSQRIRPELSINGSPKPLGVLRRNFGEMMNTPRRGYAPKITASNFLQLSESQILARTL